MERFTKPTFIFLLLSISISASVFMIIESGSFFQGLYKAEPTISFMGYWAAFLNEVFMGVMAAVWIPGKKSKLGEKIHPINVLFKLLLVFLFITTVCGSSLKTAYPLYDTVQKQENQRKVIEILKSQVNDNKKSLDAFVLQNQRVNAALSVRNQIKIKEELKQMLNTQKSTFGLWLEISVIILIRLGVQLANLSCIWLAGWLYRQPGKKQDIFHSSKYSVKNNHFVNYSQKTHSQAPSTVDIPVHKPTSKPVGHRAVYLNDKSSFTEINRIKKPKKKLETKTSDTKEKSIAQKKEQDKIYNLRVKIAQLLRSRNEGISLSDIGNAIGEREASLREIVNPKLNIDSSTMLALENILAKIENLYNEERVRMS